jgi:hypothetical protein
VVLENGFLRDMDNPRRTQPLEFFVTHEPGGSTLRLECHYQPPFGIRVRTKKQVAHRTCYIGAAPDHPQKPLYRIHGNRTKHNGLWTTFASSTHLVIERRRARDKSIIAVFGFGNGLKRLLICGGNSVWKDNEVMRTQPEL